MPALTAEEKEELAWKIDNEGFDYYFSDYGPDRRLEELFEKEISDYIDSRKRLMGALLLNGFKIET